MGIDISTIQVIQAPILPNICDTKIVEKAPGTFSFIPPHTGGDLEFGGNGPAINCTVKLVNRLSRVDAVITLNATETITTDPKKKTVVFGHKMITVFTPDPGYAVKTIIGPTSATYSYTDNDIDLDEFSGTGPVSKFVFMGDGPGNDASLNTKVDVTFNNLRFELKENGNCVDATPTDH